MNTVCFLGSPREGGNTETLLKEAVRGMGGEAMVFDLARMQISPCLNCGGCDETGECILEDDMREVYPAIREAHRVVLASPIFFMGLSAQSKAMIDRCQSFWCEKYLLKRPIKEDENGRKGLLIVVGGMKREAGVKCAGTTATAFFRTISVPEHETLAFTGVDAKGAILKHPTALKEAFEAGRKLVGL